MKEREEEEEERKRERRINSEKGHTDDHLSFGSLFVAATFTLVQLLPLLV